MNVARFIDHDITFDPASSLLRSNDPNALHNFRTPRFDLDNLYGEGPTTSRFSTRSVVVSQLQLQFLRAHNKLIELVEPASGVSRFDEAPV
ncbi:MAG TPA: hypothetical protein VFT19_00170 [Solirubrobacterales bacterium]|nr:hypothetical protein [Solirubrobacterales bacterium]